MQLHVTWYAVGGMACYGTAWHRMGQHGVAWHGMAWDGMAPQGAEWIEAQNDMAWCSMNRLFS